MLIQPFSAKIRLETSGNTAVCDRIPYATEHGINSREQGVISAGAGNSIEIWREIDSRVPA
jgi:hypothetical protein